MSPTPNSKIAPAFLRALLLLTGCVALTAGSAVTQDVPLRMLRHILEIADPVERRAAADLLAERSANKASPTPAEWRDALQQFAPAEAPLAPGRHELRVPLWNGTSTESTELCLYVPELTDDAAAMPLLHSAHGTGGDGKGVRDMWIRTADQLGMLVIAPSESGPNDGYHYADREREIARAAIRWARLHFRIDDARIYLAGVSRGGHLTWDLALRQPDLAAAIAPMIGGPRWNPDGQNNLRYLEQIKALPIRDLQGSGDDPRLLFNLRFAFERLTRFGASDARLIEFADLGHSFQFDAVDWNEFWTRRRDPSPREVVRLASRLDEARSSFVEITAFDDERVADVVRPSMPQAVDQRLDDAGKRRWIQDRVDERTARIEARWSAPGGIEVRTRHVRSFRLFITPDMLDADSRITVRHAGNRKVVKVTTDLRVLLRDFVERLDRTFLPIAIVEIGAKQ